MNSRRTGYLALACGAALAAGLLYALSDDRVTEANCQRVGAGMTEAEVDAILGAPDKPRMPLVKGHLPWPTAEYARVWRGRTGDIFVICDAEGIALGTGFRSTSWWETELRAAWWRVRRTFGL
jgi:hypothetical protein